MAISGVTATQIQDFLRNGGTLKCVVGATDIDERGDVFEAYPAIQGALHSGFEVPPSVAATHDAKSFAQLWVHGDAWTRIVARVYAENGNIVYRKIAAGLYEATAAFSG